MGALVFLVSDWAQLPSTQQDGQCLGSFGFQACQVEQKHGAWDVCKVCIVGHRIQPAHQHKSQGGAHQWERVVGKERDSGLERGEVIMADLSKLQGQALCQRGGCLSPRMEVEPLQEIMCFRLHSLHRENRKPRLSREKGH